MRAALRREGHGWELRRAMSRALPRLALLAVLWWVLTGGSAESWLFGVPVIVGSTLASLALLPAGHRVWTPSLAGAARFVPFFAWQSLAGGADVALRALRPSLPLDPDFVDYEFRLPEGPSRVFMANVISLLPGTLGAELEGRRLLVHTLSRGPGVLEGLEETEDRIADLFGLELEQHEEAPLTDEGGERGE